MHAGKPDKPSFKLGNNTLFWKKKKKTLANLSRADADTFAQVLTVVHHPQVLLFKSPEQSLAALGEHRGRIVIILCLQALTEFVYAQACKAINLDQYSDGLLEHLLNNMKLSMLHWGPNLTQRTGLNFIFTPEIALAYHEIVQRMHAEVENYPNLREQNVAFFIKQKLHKIMQELKDGDEIGAGKKLKEFLVEVAHNHTNFSFPSQKTV